MFLELVKKRRSVRRYLEKPVEREKIKLCLEAARLAPSACNGQPWKFIVVDDPTRLGELVRAAFSGPFSNNRFAGKAPVIIVAVAETTKIIPRIAGRLQMKHYSLIDLSIAVEHLVLEAADLGLGTCWIGWFNQKGVKRLLKIAGGSRPVFLIPLGYPAPGEVKPTSRKSLSEISNLGIRD